MKQCCTCHILKPYSEFNRDSSRKDKHSSQCKLCRKERHLKNKEANLSRMREWHSKNKDAVHARQKIYRSVYKEELNTRKKEWYKNNAESERYKSSQYKLQNREHYTYLENKRRARKACAVPQRWTKSEETPGKCYWCGTNINDYHEIDHIMPISLGGPAEDYNEVKTCKDCNGPSGKWDKHPLVWIAHQF